MRTENFSLIVQQAADLLSDCLDVSPHMLESIFARQEFMSYAREIYENAVSCIQLELNELLSSKEQHLSHWCHELCGAVQEQCNNGFRRYCGVHKYVHQQQKLDHDFVFKTSAQVNEEAAFWTKYQVHLRMFTEMRNALFKMALMVLHNNFDWEITNPENLPQVDQDIAAGRAFKCRYLIDGNVLVFRSREANPTEPKSNPMIV
ncbi:MAG: hypothetical protein ACYCOU_05185 [Sulfobacillus sp.]